MDTIYWKKLRVLVANKCNYRCSFCHNEGQEKESHQDIMSFADFKKLIDALKEQSISEINFSGGEPFINKQIVDIIEYAHANVKGCDISCATNLSLITESQISRLAKTNVKLNIQFPFVDEQRYKQSTGTGDLKSVVHSINAIQTAGIQIGLNTVIQSADAELVRSMIIFAINQGVPLKLLPQIGLKNSEKYKDFVYPILQDYAIEYSDKGTGATRWVVEKDNRRTVVLYVDSPCFYKDIDSCKSYGEIRIYPDFRVQTCILQKCHTKLNMDESPECVISQFKKLWMNFKTC